MTRIQEGKCTPFLGAGAAAGVLPLGTEIARDWAQKYDYPMADVSDLGRVSQYLTLEYDPIFPRERLIEIIKAGKSPNYDDPNEPHNFLSKLPLPIYMTTNYDDFMVRALEKENPKKPRREYCRWNKETREQSSLFDEALIPSKDEPLVFHLHGHDQMPESMVLTEDDYLDFLVNVSRDQLPSQIQRALSGASLLFLGYSLSDWSFRVLFRGLVSAKERNARFVSVTVQLPPTDDNLNEATKPQMRYLDQYFGAKGMRVYWGTAQEFIIELRQRWEHFTAHPVLTTSTSTQSSVAVPAKPSVQSSTTASELPVVKITQTDEITQPAIPASDISQPPTPINPDETNGGKV